ncbi:DNA/RNA non-specific endonuclease [Frankia sp. AgB1.9]|uniref:DNA/RNA non-specific endonuclease n=1 Tax=unclassified Frankia TaxID=2632575 RepID=UPI001933589B|nr:MULTISPECIES: DNA/RNA non-specific endonuclease [unclassified Frankia]MBL7490829.1 DNA/RNA non-specific endonuclease [Frankia sp. AgW1.1]MBL7551024.1 DNA/RNA non-specific endonuclease [Frankia sp. AgB1.9]MBL7621195.1 DNA/RNA non-specific endonuclease [Frankia sp. AgB1.8]
MVSVDSARTERGAALANEQQEALAARAVSRLDPRRGNISVLREPGGIARADDPARIAARIARLARHNPDARSVSPAAVGAEEPAATAEAGAVLERIIQTNDLLDVGYLEDGVAAARAVGRIVIRDDRGRTAGYGTGSLVSPELLLTNHHVLSDTRVAASSSVEFDYQDGPDGQPLPLAEFALDPDRFFLADEAMDFALVAVKAEPAQLSQFGFNLLVAAEGKAIVGDFVTIIQHPGGGKKQVALRENRIVDVLDLFMHYETDTEPGSSGSPVFNDQWEIVALHHAAVPAPEHGELGGILNEGIRVSRLLAFLRDQTFPTARQALVDRLLYDRVRPAAAAHVIVPAAAPAGPVTVQAPAHEAARIQQSVTLTVPSFDIRLHGGLAGPGLPPAAEEEAVRIDPDYTNRVGYDEDFLGSGHRVALPTLHPDQVPLAAVNQLATGQQPPYVLPYHHFSVVLNRQRRLAFFTAVNIDGATAARLQREPDRWSFDPRVPEDEQTGEQVYRDNPLDRGHLVRRLDPAWGATRAQAKLANDDTFHFTNCTPQHADFNENQTTWAGLEDYILENADNQDFKVTVFAGPVLSDDDQPYRGVLLPRQFWKIAVMVTAAGGLSATGYLLSQADLIRGLEITPAAFSYGAYSTYQVPLARIASLTGLSFGALTASDPLDRLETTEATREITHPRQLVL